MYSVGQEKKQTIPNGDYLNLLSVVVDLHLGVGWSYKRARMEPQGWKKDPTFI